MERKKRSLMFRLMSSVNIAALIILIAMTSFIITKTSEITEKQIDDEVEAMAGSLQYTLADYIISADIPSIQKISDDIVDDDVVNEVYIYDKDKKLIASAKNKRSHVIEKTKKLYESKKDITKLGDKSKGNVGSIFVKYNHNEIVEIKNQFMMFGALSIIVSQILLAFVMWFSLSKSIQAINLTTDKLKILSESTGQSSKEVESISEEVSSSANEQAASIQETVATLDEITSQVTATVDSVVNSTKKSEESLHIATEGKSVVSEMITSMESIGHSNKEIMEEIARGNERIGGIVKIINEISEKTAVINDIVFQTKLLSFNASVEAARAGEHGKGFAVVAEEVGNLAQMSGKASTEISAILSDSVVKVNSVIQETNRNVEALTKVGTEKVADGMKIAERCGTVLEDVVTNATIIKNMMNEISVASKEQAEGVRNITAAMNQLDQATLSNNKSAAMSSQSAKELSGHSIDLKQAVVELEKEIFGGEQSITASPPKRMETVEVKKIVESSPKKNNVLPMPVKKPTLIKAQPVIKKDDASVTKIKPSSTTPGYDDPRFEDV